LSAGLSLCLLLAACAPRRAAESATAQASAPDAQPTATQAKTVAEVKTYRGSLGDRGFEMRLAREGERVSGSYAYDGIGQELKLDGRATGKDKFELTETDAAGRQTGKWSCAVETQGEWGEEFSCKWTKPDGKSEMFVGLYAQATFASQQLRVAAKIVENRKAGVRASYPQLVAARGAQVSPAAAHFNRLLEEKVGKVARGFGTELDPSPNLYLHTEYNVLAATDDLVSVEVSFDSFEGGAHPNLSYDAVNYDLRADREIKLEELFKPGSNYEQTIGDFCAADMKRRMREMDAEEAKQEHRTLDAQEEWPISRDSLGQISAFAVTPKGLMIYYDLPHVIAALDRNFVPYSVIKEKLKPGSLVARSAQ
jgi:hypothetical protein